MIEKLGVLQGDITKLATDAIVNSENSSCEIGEAKITKGSNLPAQWVIHTVGPIWKDGFSGEPEALKSCYLECLKLAVLYEIKTIAFPSISCGVYGFPVDQAARIAIGTAIEFLKTEGAAIDGVSFVCFSDEDYDCYVEMFGELM